MRTPTAIAICSLLASCAIDDAAQESTTEEDLSACGLQPKAPVCNTMRCTSDGWLAVPIAAGIACTTNGTAGTCDGGANLGDTGECIPNAPPPPPTPLPISSGTVAEAPLALGCWMDTPNRALPIRVDSAGGYTVESCAWAARVMGHRYSGVQAGGACFVGDEVGARQLPASSCNTACTANGGEICGGSWANSIYQNDSVNFTYVGCYSDSATRALPAMLTSGGSTIQSCIAAAAAAGYSYAGLQYGGYCFAGNTLGFSQLGEGSCSMACSANADQACGGAWANSVYQIQQHTVPAATTLLPQGLTGGIAHVNHSCSVSLSAIETLISQGKSIIGVAAGCIASAGTACVVGLVTQAQSTINAVNNTNFQDCGPPNVFRSGSVLAASASTPTQTLILDPSGASFRVQSAPGWLTESDGDRGNSKNFGFYHQELTGGGGGTADSSLADRFKLPRGTACGFHHTQNTPFNAPAGPQSTCMGHDPAVSGPLQIGDCPRGWVAKNHFDMSSGDGNAACGNLANLADCGYFAWCEYTDPNGNCDNDPSCLANARANGYAIGISSDSDAVGAESYGGATTASAPCPPGFSRTNFYDDGRSAGQGLSWCAPVPDLPQGLTAGLAYFTGFTRWGGTTYEAQTPSANGDGFQLVFDGDFGQPGGTGFFHQELASGGLTHASTSAAFQLFPGTTCGFHHTLNSPGRTCMGIDPATGLCPAGWLARRHFDMSSGSGYYVWCEYQDPSNYCTNPNAPPYPNITQCQAFAHESGYTNTVTSNTDATGVAQVTNGACIGGWSKSPFFDAGRSSGQGLSFCVSP